MSRDDLFAAPPPETSLPADAEKPVMITITPPLEITSFSAITPISLDQSTLFTNTTIGGAGSNVWSYSIYSGPVGGSLIGIGNNKFKFTVAGTYVVLCHL